MKKRVNKCASYDEHWGCVISPMKKCEGCPDADWHTVLVPGPAKKKGKIKKEYWVITLLGPGMMFTTKFIDHAPTRDDLKMDNGYGNIIFMKALTKKQFINLRGMEE